MIFASGNTPELKTSFLRVFGNDLRRASAADTGNFFRVAGNHYEYNLDTSTFTPGTWQLKAALDDGTSHTVIISIKS